ncbi:unnamed protein product [Caenorhabditis angaria]|uniref:DUF4139 domain-containing protein n=1 Tax=Caenorhabditis angaria TaxID=860376 RepID=A0A9P1N4F7_9PELO|nr:unnamed protein product [Caenorhabditis angaria]
MEESRNAVDLYITYQVYCASWKPAYDIRASTAEDDTAPPTASSVQLCYYGLVEQNTGDDWTNCELVLSTCSASLGGSAPPLGTLSASLARRHTSARRNKAASAPSEEDMGFGSFDYNEICDAAALHRLTNLNSTTKSGSDSISILEGVENSTGSISTCFAIPRNVTIMSNGAEHKLLISKSDLSCAFSHESVPSKSTHAFLSAIITNTSQLPLLAGPAAVYVNNCYVTKTHLRLVPPGGEFRCNMGVDASIKVEYKTPSVTYEQVGFMSKSTLMSHEQIISVRNAKVKHSVRITIKEQIPKSHDDKIKVAVVQPECRANSNPSSAKKQHIDACNSEARLNKDHNLEWTIVLAPGQHRNLPIRYTVEHPASESISYRFT